MSRHQFPPITNYPDLWGSLCDENHMVKWAGNSQICHLSPSYMRALCTRSSHDVCNGKYLLGNAFTCNTTYIKDMPFWENKWPVLFNKPKLLNWPHTIGFDMGHDHARSEDFILTSSPHLVIAIQISRLKECFSEDHAACAGLFPLLPVLP